MDKDFCLRVINAGLQIIAVKEAVLHHQLGQSRDHSLMGIPVTTTNHSPERCYYIYRNRAKSWGRYGSAQPGFVIYDMMAMGYDVLRLICFEDRKLAKFGAMARGLRDACSGVSGSVAHAGRL